MTLRVITLLALGLCCAVPARAADEGGHARKPLPSPEAIKKLPADGGKEFNRLVFEKSPYLLQHARNPVDWYPWGEAAFAKAKAENKPVFLSVGYATCHWCHVMERESFEDEEVAALLNKWFVPIKVDREERPDIDQVYMTYTQMYLGGGGGWPMTVMMTAEKKPFFAGTYFPKWSRFRGRRGMMDLLPLLGEMWQKDRKKLVDAAEKGAIQLSRASGGQPGPALGEKALKLAYSQLTTRFEPNRGGFSTQPKFPMPHNLSFLMRYYLRSGDKKALAMVEKTLQSMRLGGIYDHIGFGFHRYSTDRQWLLPHFEKMLYDQALLAIAYLEAYQITKKPMYAQTAREIFIYIRRDMTAPEGGFYSAEDADSEGEEGRFYVWSNDETSAVLNAEENTLFNRVYNMEKRGNFVDQAARKRTGFSIPHLRKPLDEIAAGLKMESTELHVRMKVIHRKLFRKRETRIHPLKDDKVLTDWNGLMIAAMAMGYQVLGDEADLKSAQKAADFALTTLRDKNGRLLKRFRQGEAGLAGHLEDYAFLVWGLLNMYEADFNPRWLKEAIALNDTMLKHFWDDKNGGLFLVADDSEQLLVRSKEIYDGAIPSGNSAAMLNLMRLARITGNVDYEKKAAAVITAFSGAVGRGPASYSRLMCGLDFAVGPSYEIVVTGKSGSDATVKMLAAVRQRYIPSRVLLYVPLADKRAAAVHALAPYTKDMKPIDGTATAYVCLNFACKLPTTKIDEMLKNFPTP